MKKISILLCIMALVLTGCGFDGSQGATDRVTPPKVEQIPITKAPPAEKEAVAKENKPGKYYLYAKNYVLNDIISFANEVDITDTSCFNQENTGYYLTDLTGDKKDEMVVSADDGLFLVYTLVNDNVVKIHTSVNGFMGTATWLTEYKGEDYLVQESFSSATGFRISLLQFDSYTGDAIEMHYSCQKFEYLEDGVSPEEHEAFKQSVLVNKKTFYSINELANK